MAKETQRAHKKDSRYLEILEACWNNPTLLNKDLAKIAGCSEATVMRSVAKLRQLQWIRLKVDPTKAFALKEKVRLSIKVDPRVKSTRLRYKGRNGLAEFLVTCVAHPDFKEYKGHLRVESVETVIGNDADVVMIIWADEASTWRAFSGQIEQLAGVIDTDTRMLFPVT